MRSLSREAGKKEVTPPLKARRAGPRALFLAVSACVFLIDQITKAAVTAYLVVGQTLAVLPGVFHLTRVNNTGAAFGLLRGWGGFLVFFSAACALFLVAVLTRSVSPARNWALSLILGGALGNLFDRVHYGYVIDFLDFRVWPVFNMADAAICAGVGICILSFFNSSR